LRAGILTRPSAGLEDEGDRVQEQIASERSRDIVFAIVAHAGSGAGWVARTLKDELSAKGYLPIPVSLSAEIDTVATRLGIKEAWSDALDRAFKLQNAGDELRRLFGFSIVAALAVRKIHIDRPSRGNESKPLAFVIDQLKHPEEVRVLRDVYGSAFYVVSVLCEYEERLRRLELKFKNVSDRADRTQKLMERDEDEAADHGQHVRKTIHLADFFVANQDPDKKVLTDDLSRFVEIVAGREVTRPTRQERGMHAAWSAALRSSCLSRQVGAAILDTAGHVIAHGTNEVPKCGGGAYESGDLPDHRCFADPGERDKPYCRNEIFKREIYREVFDSLMSAELLVKNQNPKEVQKAVEKTRIRDLIEFSRAVHAEMDALLSLGRIGGLSSTNCSLYCTTFPCHSCAKHIVAAGIKEVVYIEPYQKSLAQQLHGDAIEVSALPAKTSTVERVRFHLFSGVAPRRFASVFEAQAHLKDKDGNLSTEVATVAQRHSLLQKSYLDLENEIVELVENLKGSEAGDAA
jgi:deoxycytidylate deaminase